LTLIVSGNAVVSVGSFRRLAKRLEGPGFQAELFRGLVDVGRKEKTLVQKTVTKQMAMKSYGFVSRNTRGTPRRALLAYDIYAYKGGQPIEDYKGLRVLKHGGKLSKAGNLGRNGSDRGSVQSGVWNVSRVFKRSFQGSSGGLFAVLPGTSGGKAPKALWTYGLKPKQGRDGSGKFKSTGKTYGKVRKLYGASLREEIAQGETLAVFMTTAAPALLVAIEKRLSKFLRFD
jgi:hypothetical protein